MHLHDTSTTLDAAFDRLAGSDFELPNGFVNHGPMACEALATLGYDDEVEAWAQRFAAMTGEGPRPVAPEAGRAWSWAEALGDYRRLPEWIGYFEQAIADDGWRSVVAGSVPRLVPALGCRLYHGAIRAAHATRALDVADTPERRAELARALGYWAARFALGASPDPPAAAAEADVDGQAIVRAGAAAAHRYLDRPDIFRLHGVTGSLAAALLAEHLAPSDAAAALAQLRAEQPRHHRERPDGAGQERPEVFDERLGRAAAASHDAHEVKLVEACRRGYAALGDPVFVEAAAVVTAGR